MSASSPTSPRSWFPCAEQLDAVLARAVQDGLSHQQFLHLLIAEQADQRRERSIARRIREARFAERKPLSEFDWEFNREAIDRTQIEELATGGFIERRENLIMVGQSGVGKSFLLQAIGEAACVLGYSVRYTTSAAMLEDLTAAIADRTLPKRVRYYANFDFLIIDEFGYDHIEREQSPQAANLFFKIIDARNRPSFDRPGHQHGLQGLGQKSRRVQSRRGIPRSHRRRRHHPQNQRQILSRPSRSTPEG